MAIIKNDRPHTVVAIVRASSKISSKNDTKKLRKYKHKFNRELLPAILDYYTRELRRFHQRKNQIFSLCPFHNERNPSFTANLKSGAFLCFACGTSGGDIIDFHMKRYNLNFVNACKDLGVWHE